MKRLLSLLGLFLAFAIPNHAQTKTDTIKFDVMPEGESSILEYEFWEQVRNGIEIEWVSSNGTENGKFTPDADGKYTQTITGSGKVYIYYTHEQSSGYTAYIGSPTTSVYDIKVERANAGITSLNVSGCTALERLWCSNNQLRSLDLSGCTALESLSCYHNQLTSLDVSKNSALTWLYCYRNQLTSLDLSHNTALMALDCGANRLTSLDLNHNTALMALECYDNQLTSLDLSHNTALTGLDCGGNRLTSLDVSHNTALERLWCHSNPLTSLDVSKNTALTSLICSSNQLTSLDISKHTALKDLNCSSNQLTSLDVSHNTALEYLECGGNELTSLDLSHNTALTTLSCGDNELTSLDVSKNTKLEGLACYNNQLRSLDVSHNTALMFLNCHSNQLTSLDLSHNTALITLSCRGNELTSLDLSHNTTLTSLECYNNHIPLSDLYKAYIQNPDWEYFVAYGQSDSLTLPINQVLDLSSERLLGESLSTFEITPDAYTENNFTFQFKKVQPYTLTIENSGIRNHIPYDRELNGIALTFTYYISVEIPEGYYTVQVKSNNPEWGTATVTGEGLYEDGAEVTITATANEGYRFVNWTNNGTEFSKEAVYKFAVTENLELTANFEKVPDDVATGRRESDNFYVYAQDRNIILSETRGLVQVFNAVGQCVYSGNATIIPVRQSGVYVVRVGANSHKVIVK